jgi:hypothetical protein
MRYRMQDGTTIDTDRSTDNWEEQRDHDGKNWISRATGSQWEHERLFRSRRGRFYIEHTSQWQGRLPWAEWVSPERAAAWLDANEYEIPAELAEAAEAVTE